MSQSKSYWDIVWAQYKKNRPALVSLLVIVPLFLLAIFAPLLASDQPLVYRAGGETLYPWFRALFNPAEPVDFAFNMALLGFVPWLLAVTLLDGYWRRRGVAGRSRIAWGLALLPVITAILCAVFSFDALRPRNRYADREFAREQFDATGDAWALYTPIRWGPTRQDLESSYQPPGFCKPGDQWRDVSDRYPHLLGTDDAGRDVLVKMLYGTRLALTVGFVAVGIYLSIGIAVGAIAGYFGGWVDILISRLIEVMMLFPAFFLILTLVGLLGPSIYIIMVVIGLTGWPSIARLTRGEVLRQRQIDYVAAALALGASHPRIIFRHILPNALAPALVTAPFGVAGAIITEAGLSLLGFGVRPPAPSWGSVLQLGNSNYHYWWLIVVPALAMFVTVTLFNLIGSGLRDAMDPRLRM